MIARRLAFLAAPFATALLSGTAGATCPGSAVCTCVISLTSLAFGEYNPQAPAPTDTVGTISILCNSPDPATSALSISLSPGSSGNANSRTLTLGSHPLYYNLYTNAARTVVWGDGSGGGESVVSTFPIPSHSSKTFSIYGRIPALQKAWAGSYRDTITVTVTY